VAHGFFFIFVSASWKKNRGGWRGGEREGGAVFLLGLSLTTRFAAFCQTQPAGLDFPTGEYSVPATFSGRGNPRVSERWGKGAHGRFLAARSLKDEGERKSKVRRRSGRAAGTNGVEKQNKKSAGMGSRLLGDSLA